MAVWRWPFGGGGARTELLVRKRRLEDEPGHPIERRLVRELKLHVHLRRLLRRRRANVLQLRAQPRARFLGVGDLREHALHKGLALVVEREVNDLWWPRPLLSFEYARR